MVACNSDKWSREDVDGDCGGGCAQLSNRWWRLISQVLYHILLVIGLACVCLLGDDSGGEATLKPVVGLTIGIAFRTRVVTGGECWTFMYIFWLYAYGPYGLREKDDG